MFQRLVVAIDDTPAAPVQVSFAAALAARHQAVVHVVFVNQYLIAGRGHTDLSDGEAEVLVYQAVDELRSSGIEADWATVKATCFDIGAAIVAEANKWGADAIIVGSHHRRHLRRLGGHGVREQVTQLTDLPVLTAPAPLRVNIRLGWEASSSANPPSPEAKRRSRSPRRDVERRS
jgi:nucleotide-binding universal stress UspA family protein